MRKVILQGDALKLLYTFLDYVEASPDQMAAAMNYDPDCLLIRARQLAHQVQDGEKIWDDEE